MSHLGEDETKCILFKKGKKQYPTLNITKNKNKIKQYSAVAYLRCLLDEKMSGESMAKRAFRKLMEKQNFFIGRIGTYHTFLKECYELSDKPHFDFAYCAWYPNLSM